MAVRDVNVLICVNKSIKRLLSSSKNSLSLNNCVRGINSNSISLQLFGVHKLSVSIFSAMADLGVIDQQWFSIMKKPKRRKTNSYSFHRSFCSKRSLSSVVNVSFVSSILFLILVSIHGKNVENHPEKTPEEIKDLLTKSKIIPDVLPTSAPSVVKVAYGDKIVDFGNNLTKTETWHPPTYVNWKTEPNCYYCLIMADPDYPDASFKSGQWQHWKVGNIPGTEISKGQSMSDYIGVQAPKGSGMHRYVFVVYKQPDGQKKFDEFHLINFPADDLRANFSTKEFAEQYGFGDPIAVNYFMSEWDDYPEFKGEIPEPNFAANYDEKQ